MRALTYNDARRLVDAATARARASGIAVSVAVVDEARDLLAFGRMEEALLASIETAQGKAFTARTVNRATRDVGRDSLPGGPLYGLETTHSRPLVMFGGGQPIVRDGAVVGAIGVAGGTP